ncbi:Fe(3+) ABC transporter substrate-binding protein [Microbulbifer sp. OS29]|uniref:Fe(3+) ABC transporter substrate-binding protein n=1 Tax=Microbulbifer okhotskensis TaxID=2926617 RepID=A0A9X2EN56_9GAMM|nr:Fe(3+) ABC transporter substrate-binding protein [Microbulbifer okhotskensis]MCO1334205.1 Fe(3+) ABC transporter substrate-binding protein [Microbulbifer okhotskensis]
MSTKVLFKKVLAVAGLLGAVSASAAEQVNIYSFRQSFLIEPILQEFTDKTGIEARVVYASKGLNERLQREGRNSPADLVLTSNTSSLMDLLNKQLTQPVSSKVLENNIPSQFRDKAGNWFGLTTRARLIYASKDRVKPGEITRYEELVDSKWKGRICTRSGKHPYTLSLIASMIAHHGEAGAKEWLQGVKANLARKPQGNDRTQVKAISEGVCDLSLGNSYYFGKMITNSEQPEQVDWAKSVNLIFPNQQDRGTHMFISGAALTKHAPNRENAVKLLEFLSSADAQYAYAEQNFEFPVRPGTARSELIKEYMGKFKEDDLSLTEIGSHVPAASRLVDEVHFDF